LIEYLNYRQMDRHTDSTSPTLKKCVQEKNQLNVA
jgi:hypothetical protein